ncbi:MAG TPA: F0F1 ATP synthase subunit A [Acidimicrobiia bacterium]|nr:F0F1 ATP synthase subunit A [Acidimicrobiia bacterium]
MDQLTAGMHSLANTFVVAAEECDLTQPMCAPADVSELFVLPNIFGQVNRTIILFFLAALIVVAVLYFALRRPSLVPTKFQAAVESVATFIREDIALGIIGPEGLKYFPYLLSLFLFILVGNLFEVTPLINFPITSRMAIPGFLALVTYVIYLFVGFKKNGFKYLKDTVWPSYVPAGLRPLIGLIELAQYLVIRPFSLAVRLFANLVAGHTMLSLLLATGVIFVGAAFTGDVSILKGGAGVLWFVMGLGIYVFEILVSVLQAYIFTLLSAVYIADSVEFGH